MRRQSRSTASSSCATSSWRSMTPRFSPTATKRRVSAVPPCDAIRCMCKGVIVSASGNPGGGEACKTDWQAALCGSQEPRQQARSAHGACKGSYGMRAMTRSACKRGRLRCCAGAQVMSLVNSDENKTFGIVLRTPVENSKGIPHILEHSVLCGSRKYPIKEPFVELMKVSFLMH